ncbi:hypothetical protein IHE44_0007165, partial [Lamprotornis superbus]
MAASTGCYSEGDFSGQLLAYLSLGPIFIIVGFVTLIIFKRELHTISFLGGLVFNEGVNWLIKNVIREPRPCEEAHSTVTTKYGMPSSHSQFMWFFSVYSFLFLYLRMHQTNNARFLDLLWRHVLSICLVTVALLVSYSRVYLLYHTWSQVLYGGVAGSIMAIAWFAFTQEILTPLFPRIAAWPISEFFLIRDTSLIPNILWFEYTVTRAEASCTPVQYPTAELILTDLSGLSMDCTNLREATEAERMVSVRPRRNILSDALSYVAQAWPYILGQGGERQQ